MGEKSGKIQKVVLHTIKLIINLTTGVYTQTETDGLIALMRVPDTAFMHIQTDKVQSMQTE